MIPMTWRFVLTIVALSLATSARANLDPTHSLDQNPKFQPHLEAKLLWLEAERLYREDRWPKAANRYVHLLDDYPTSAFAELARGRLFEIANFWLEDTRQEMREWEEVEQGARHEPLWWICCRHLIHFDQRKPLLGEEDAALALLKRVAQSDSKGMLSRTALFLIGSVHFFRERYGQADLAFTCLVESCQAQREPPSRLFQNAFKLAVISKTMALDLKDVTPASEKKKLLETQAFIAKFTRENPQEAAALNEDHFLDKQQKRIAERLAELE